MKSQIFKISFPNELLFDLLRKSCVKQSAGYYLFDKSAYKRALINSTSPQFIEDCKPYYHLSKMKYLEKPLTYNSLVTVIRQICNQNKIVYTSKIKYNKSSYEINYFIYDNI